MMNIAIFASGSGSNFQAIVDQVQAGRLQNVSIKLLVCDRPQAKVIERAQQAGIDRFIFRPRDYPTREHYEREILQELTERNIDLVVLAGYMRLLTPVLTEAYAERMINIHPALLPAFPGVNSIQQALDYGVKITGVTVHFVDEGMDTGAVIAQQHVIVEDQDSIDTLSAKIHAAEHELLPKVIRWISEGRVQCQGRKVSIEREGGNRL